MYSRDLINNLKLYGNFPAIALLGPRQSGKTTLVKMSFPRHRFLSLDDETVRSFAAEDPKRFLASYENEHGLVLDEIQNVPNLMQYIKIEIDEKKRPSYFVMTGSQNFLVNQAITESLAGRVGILNLLPLSLNEMTTNGLLGDKSLDQTMLDGFYPRIFSDAIGSAQFYPSYIQSYVERDVRALIQIGNLSLFQRFLQLCAGRVGQLLNIDSLAADCGVSSPTIRSWLSILEASFVIFLLQPHFKNFNKRLTRSPKLYFFDTGLACSLLRITDAHMLSLSPFRGHLFESFVVADLYKQYTNRAERPSLFFWRDRGGVHEVDCIIDQGNTLHPLEIKSGNTVNAEFFKGLNYWNALAEAEGKNGFLVYGGTERQIRPQAQLVDWRSLGTLLQGL